MPPMLQPIFQLNSRSRETDTSGQGMHRNASLDAVTGYETMELVVLPEMPEIPRIPSPVVQPLAPTPHQIKATARHANHTLAPSLYPTSKHDSEQLSTQQEQPGIASSIVALSGRDGSMADERVSDQVCPSQNSHDPRLIHFSRRYSALPHTHPNSDFPSRSSLSLATSWPETMHALLLRNSTLSVKRYMPTHSWVSTE
jgi:hypothetical protein